MKRETVEDFLKEQGISVEDFIVELYEDGCNREQAIVKFQNRFGARFAHSEIDSFLERYDWM